MPNYNRVVLMGHVTRDPEIRNTTNGTKVAKFGLAVNNVYAKKEDKDVMFIDLTAFNKTADVIERFTKKGNALLVEGRLQLEQWEDKNGGGRRSKHSVIVDAIQFVGGKPDGIAAPQSTDTPPADEPPSGGGDIPF